MADSLSSALRLRSAGLRRARAPQVDAEIFVPPKFLTLVLWALACVILQGTLLGSWSLRHAHLSALTVLIVWVGLRCGVTTGGWLGFIGGLLEDTLGGHGVNVIGTTLIGLLSGLLSSRFFYDSLPIFVTAAILATVIRQALAYLVLEVALGYRALFYPMSHELVWQALINAALAMLVLIGLRIRSAVRAPARR